MSKRRLSFQEVLYQMAANEEEGLPLLKKMEYHEAKTSSWVSLSYAAYDYGFQLDEIKAVARQGLIRREPATLNIDIEVPKPMREVPATRTHYWYIHPGASGGVGEGRWTNNTIDFRRLRQGRCFEDKEDAKYAYEEVFGPRGLGQNIEGNDDE